METTTFNYQHSPTYTTQVSIFQRFINWCEAQQDSRILWIGIGLVGHGCIFTPLTIMFVLYNGNSLPLFMIAMFAMAAVLVTNLAAMPTKITIPTLAISLLADLGIIITAFITA